MTNILKCVKRNLISIFQIFVNLFQTDNLVRYFLLTDRIQANTNRTITVGGNYTLRLIGEFDLTINFNATNVFLFDKYAQMIIVVRDNNVILDTIAFGLSNYEQIIIRTHFYWLSDDVYRNEQLLVQKKARLEMLKREIESEEKFQQHFDNK